jgi:hypothetical protein
VLDYLTHQRLLFPALATTYAMHLSMDRLKVWLMRVHRLVCTVHSVPHGHEAESARWVIMCVLSDLLSHGWRPLLQLLAKDRRPQDAKLVHVRSSGLKAAATWHRVEILQVRVSSTQHPRVGVATAWLCGEA